MSTPIVKINNVSIVFGDKPDTALGMIDKGESREEIKSQTSQILGVANASIDVEEGEILVLMGLSGSGKSTLLRGINGLNKITRGSIEITTDKGPVDVANCSSATLRDIRTHNVSMVFQQFGLLPWRTVEDNVGFGLELSGVSGDERKTRVAEQLALVGLSEWGDKFVQELSGGMQQRVGLARAFATGAPILLMDEPYSALDPLIRAHLQDELLELQRKLKCTIIFVSHDLDEAIKIGNRIAIMEGGRIVQVGTPQDIILNPVDDYVADFVAHMNPMQVLRAREIMSPLDGKASVIEGRQLIHEDERYSIHPLQEDEDCPQSLPAQSVLSIPLETSVKKILGMRIASQWPILVHDKGEVQGIIMETDIYDALIR
jgi:glycine betaine/proline transport system ATP-binding protein